MNKFVVTGLRARILLLISLAFAPWLLSNIYQNIEARNHAIVEAQTEALQLLNIIAFDQKETLLEARSFLQILSSLPAVNGGSPAVCNSFLAGTLKQSKNYINFGVLDPHGRLLCDALNSRDSISFNDRVWFKQLLETRQFVISSLITGRLSQKPVIVGAMPLLDSRGKVKRVVWAALDIGRIKRLLEKISLPEGTDISVMDANGTIVACHPDAERCTGNIQPLPQLVQAVRAQQEEGTGQAMGKDHIQRLFAYHRLFESADMGRIYVSATVPAGIFLAKSSHAFAQSMWTLGMVTLLIFALAWFGIDMLILRRMQALIQSARQISRGNFSARTHLGKGKDEVCELALAFDNMAQSLELLFEQNQRIMEVTPEAMIISDVKGTMVMANAQAEKLFGYTRDELIGQPIDILLPERFRPGHGVHRENYLAQSTSKQMGMRRELLAVNKDGKEFPAEISLGTLKTNDGFFAISAVRDITERKQFENQILHQATHDSLTGLPNRAFLHDMLEHSLPHTLRIEKLLVIMLLDLDGFKNINDTLGHGFGDRLLIEIANRLKLQIRKDDMVARQGGDEFTILLQNISNVQDVSQIAEKILKAVSEPVVSEGQEMHVTASIGITVFPFDDTDIELLLRNADTAMYRAKEAGKNTFQFYTAAMNAAIRERMEIENGLRYALARNELLLHYHPQVDIDSGRIIAVEALVRWLHPEKGLIPPDKFIHIAEESGLIVAIGEWVLRTACKQSKAWQDAGLPHIRMAVNLSTRQFRTPRLAEVVVKAMEEAGLALHSDNLELELTESMIMSDVDAAVDTLNSLHAIGVRLSIDDFGTGYSSLSYLKRFSINTLKIDQSFVRDITVDQDDAAIAAAIIMLGHNLNMRVIAEGVETAGQLEILREMKCDEIQGFYFSKPVPAAELETLLMSGRRLGY